jgi:alpha-L-rhamnosidase
MRPSNDARIASLRFEHLTEPVGIGVARPRVSWTVETGVKDWIQAGYEIGVADGNDPAGEPWPTSGRIDSAESVLVPWPAQDLASRQRRAVRVRAWGVNGSVTQWSEPFIVEAGLLSPADWSARGIGPPLAWHQPPPAPAVLLRKQFQVRSGIVRARLYVTAHGLYDLALNNTAVSENLLAPGWTSYGHRLRYETHDVTALLRSGDNAIGATVADGWYRGRLGFRGGVRNLYGERVALIAQLEVDHTDGTREVVVTDDTWTWGVGPVISTGLYEGERFDARLEPTGWSAPGFDDASWDPVETVPYDPVRMVAPLGPAVRRTATLAPVGVRPSRAGGSIVDFGQNMSGRLRIAPRGPAGRTVTLRHAEELEADGELAVEPLRGSAQLDEYTLRGDQAPEEWEPRFTIHGFRYAELHGWPGGLKAGDVQAVVCHTDMRRTGWFDCSDPLLNRLHDNVVWSMRSNFVDLPTDCPQRDERLGWTGDIQVFGPTASFLYDCAGLLTSWLADLAAEQDEHGTVPHYVPWIPLVFDIEPAAAWGDAAVIVPWVLHQRFGDVGILRQQYPSMTAWVDQIAHLAGESHLWDRGFQFGDWLDPAAPADRPAAALTDQYLVATAYHAFTAQLLADIADILGENEDHVRYGALASAVRQAFTDEFVAPSGRLVSDTQAAYALALQFNLLAKPEQRERAGRRLAELVAAGGHHIGTGFVGTPLICDALTTAGAVDTAYQLLLQTECPSWLYPLTMGATTIWERWDSRMPDGRINPSGMTSFNHYALGAVADWMHRTVAGLAPAAPGYRVIRVAPRPGGGLTYARAEHDTPYGRASVAWTREGGRFDLTVTAPPGTSAQIELPSVLASTVEIGSGTHTFSCDVRPADQDPRTPDPVNVHAADAPPSP